MHNLAPLSAPIRTARPPRSHLSLTHITRAAELSDVEVIHGLIACHAEAGLVLPRSRRDIEESLGDFVAVTGDEGRVMAAAALTVYSPQLAEVSSVVVAPDAQGLGLGSMAVLAVEAMARQHEIEELFALTLADGFFQSLGYEPTSVARYPGKLARYEELARRGVQVLPKSCYRKVAAAL
ncbi:MAG: GNAT family N-acetyltransferase [Gemmatimonadaceae bacterium]